MHSKKNGDRDDKMKTKEDTSVTASGPSKRSSMFSAPLPKDQTEIDKTLQSINKYQTRLSKLDAAIGVAEKALAAQKAMVNKKFEERKEEYRKEYLQKLKALEEKRKERMSKMEEKHTLATQGLRDRRHEIDKKLKKEKGFLAPIRKLPPEIMIEVLKWRIGNNVPSRSLALVCREWNHWIRKTSSLWSNIEAHFVASALLPDSLDQLERRIERSGSILLDITLDIRYYSVGMSTELFACLAKTKLERWKSLKIVKGWHNHSPQIDAAFEGKLTNLRSLHCNGDRDDGIDPFIPLYKSIIQSKPPIQNLHLQQLPVIFNDSAVFRDVPTISASWDVIVKLHPLRNLQNLEVSYINSNVSDGDLNLFPPLAEQTTFVFLRKSLLRSLQLDNVRILNIAMGTEEIEDYMLNFPNLESLTLSLGSLCDIKGVSAPQLRSLQISHYTARNGKVKESASVTSLFQDNMSSVRLRPTTLELHVSITAKSLIEVLQSWPQIQHLSLRFDDFSWKGGFANGLLKRSNRLCPRLVTLEMDSRNCWKFEADEFASMVKKLFQDRKGGDLESVKWKNRERKWESLTRDDVA